jgi:hypothetical protein
MRRILCILTITAIILIGTVAAAPVIPQGFFGSVYLNGNPAPAGTVIVAKINGDIRGELTTTVDGLYGDQGNFDPRLFVTATEAEANSGNATIIFFVGGVQAFQTVPFQSGGPGKLDLLANDRAFGTDTTSATISSSPGGSTVGSVSSVSGTGTRTTSGNAVRGSNVTTTPVNESRSSIYYNTDATPSPLTSTEIVPVVATPSSVVTTVPTTKKAGDGPLSVVLLVASIIAVLCVVERADFMRRRR